MAKYRIGITECGDAGIDLSWKEKMGCVDAAILITKEITPEFIEAVLEFKDRVIVHSTITGYGGTVLEPNVPRPEVEIKATNNLVRKGFPKSHIVIRVDPIIPTNKGFIRATRVFNKCIESGYERYRVSIIDMYHHVRERFKQHNLPLPYGENFYPNRMQFITADSVPVLAKAIWRTKHPDNPDGISIEGCCEPMMKCCTECGCISKHDLNILGLVDDEDDYPGYQRKYCSCYSGKTELLESKHQCAHGCLYCYWK